jgi:hypothetical protein
VKDYGLIHPKAGEPRVFGDCDGNISFMEDDFHEEGEDRIGFGGRLEVSEVFGGPEGLLLREAACGDEVFLSHKGIDGFGGGACGVVENEVIEEGRSRERSCHTDDGKEVGFRGGASRSCDSQCGAPRAELAMRWRYVTLFS